MRSLHTGSRRVLGPLAAVSVLIFAAPAFAQTANVGADADSVSSGQPPQPTENADPNGAQPGDHSAGAGDQSADDHTKPPSQRLPEPKSSDYGASNYNAPGDAQLDQSAARHQPDTPGQSGHSSTPNNKPNAAAPQPPIDEQNDTTADSAAPSNID